MNSNVQGTAEISRRDKVLVMIGIYCLMITSLFSMYEFTTALPKILSEIGGSEMVSYVFTAFLLGGAIMSPIAGNLSHIYGRRRVLLITAVGLVFAEAAAALVTNISELIILRGIHGMLGAFSVTIGFIVISDLWPPPERAKWLGMYGSMLAALMLTAPTVGGVIVDNFNWRFIFFAVIPVAAIGWLLIWRFMPVIPRSNETKMDILGAIVMAVTISLMVLSTVWGGKKYDWGSSTMIILYIVILIGIWLFVYIEKHAKQPIVPMSLFQVPIFKYLLLAALLTSVAAVPVTYYFPLWAQKIRGLSATEAGLLMTYKGLVTLIASYANGWIISRIKEFRWNAMILILLLGLATFSYSMMDATTSFILIGVTIFVWGVAGGSSNVFHIGSQMTLNNVQIVAAMGVMQLAVAFGAVFGNITAGVFLKNADLAKGIQNAFIMGVVTCLIVLLLVVIMLVQRKKAHSLINNEDSQAVSAK